MKFKLLVLLSLAAFLLLSGCRGGDNTNVNRSNLNENRVANMATPVTQTNESATTDPALKGRVEAALKAKGFNDVTIDTSTPRMTARGTVPKGKLGEAMAVIMEANGGKPVDNQVAEK